MLFNTFNYHGSVDPDLLPQIIEGHFGLIWEGNENSTITNTTIKSEGNGISHYSDNGTYTLNVKDSNISGKTNGIYGYTNGDDRYVKVNIESGKIEGGLYGIQSNRKSVTVNIGLDDDNISITNPEIIGGKYGIYSQGT